MTKLGSTKVPMFSLAEFPKNSLKARYYTKSQVFESLRINFYQDAKEPHLTRIILMRTHPLERDARRLNILIQLMKMAKNKVPGSGERP